MKLFFLFAILLFIAPCNELFGQKNFYYTPLFNKNLKPDTILISDLPWFAEQYKHKNEEYTEGWTQHLLHDPLWAYGDNRQQITLNPHVLLAANSQISDKKNYFITGGGAQLHYQNNQKFLINTSFKWYHSDGFAIDSNRVANNLMPGVLYSKYSHAGFSALDFRLHAVYSPSEYFRLTTGIDDHFVGDGYHSIIMSDYSTPHPFGRLSTSFWKIDYMVQYNFMKDIQWPDLSELQNKYMTAHQLNFRVHPSFHVYLWEAVVWKAEDSVARRGYDLSYVNPVIFFRPVEFQLGFPSPDNILMAGGFRWQPLKRTRLYAQVLIDEFSLTELINQSGWWANKYAIQMGGSVYFRKNESSLKLLGEFNMSRPFNFSHIHSMQNYGSRFYPLAHPMGANFSEFLFAGQYFYKRFGVDCRMALISTGSDSEEVNYGQNIYRSYTERESEYNHRWLQGNFQEALVADLQISYVVNPVMGLKVAAGARRVADFNSYVSAPGIQKELYIRLATFLTSDMKQLYRNRLME